MHWRMLVALVYQRTGHVTPFSQSSPPVSQFGSIIVPIVHSDPAVDLPLDRGAAFATHYITLQDLTGCH